MITQQELDYNRIAKVIRYINANFKQQPSLEELAEQVNLSPYHFQRLFKQWAGTTPKKFLQFISLNHAKNLLRERQTTLFEASFDTGLSGTARLHDLFVKIEGMTPAEFKNAGANLDITYNYHSSLFGNLLIGSTPKGICHLSFYNDPALGFSELKGKFPNARFIQKTDRNQRNALGVFTHEPSELEEIKLHLKATDFQLKVWEALLRIPFGELSTYGKLAKQIGNPNASRAVGTAIGSNCVAILIPCHRIIQSTGAIGGYKWETSRKTALIGWEQAQLELESQPNT